MASVILLYYPGTRPMEVWMCCRLASNESSHRTGLTEEDVLTLPLLDHPCAAVLSMYVWMCAKSAILGAKIRSCMSSNPRSRLFIVIAPVDLEEDIRRAWVASENGGCQKSTGPLGLGIPLPLRTLMHR